MTAKNDNPVDIGAKTLVGCSRSPMLEPKNDGIYVIELCSGELRHWGYLGQGRSPTRGGSIWNPA